MVMVVMVMVMVVVMPAMMMVVMMVTELDRNLSQSRFLRPLRLSQPRIVRLQLRDRIRNRIEQIAIACRLRQLCR
jgi:hypothetical protein